MPVHRVPPAQPGRSTLPDSTLYFAVFSDGKPAEQLDLTSAYLLGSDDVPLRAEISFKGGLITCRKRAAGPAGIALAWPVGESGVALMESIRVVERKRPYVLQIELARGRLMRVYAKLEDWGLMDDPAIAEARALIEKARDLLIRALQAEGAEAATYGQRALEAAVRAGEELARVNAALMFDRRRQSGGLSKRVLGCTVQPETPPDKLASVVAKGFDFASLPTLWREIEPQEQSFNWAPLDGWVEGLSKRKVPIVGGPLVAFNEQNVPDWLYIWEHDFDTMRDMAAEHARRVVSRYAQQVQAWKVISGIHAENCFSFNFEQLMELTRMAAAVARQAAPRAATFIELVAPWGEYYARNQRTVPPLLYADMVVQSGVNFDAFGLQFLFGPAADGSFVRDMFQVSSMLDAFGKLGKPLHVTAVQVPSQPASKTEVTVEGGKPPADGGAWRKPWTEELQAQWCREFVQVALSKPFVETVAWRSLTDGPRQIIPSGGLMRADYAIKPALREFVRLRQQLTGAEPDGAATDK